MLPRIVVTAGVVQNIEIAGGIERQTAGIGQPGFVTRDRRNRRHVAVAVGGKDRDTGGHVRSSAIRQIDFAVSIHCDRFREADTGLVA